MSCLQLADRAVASVRALEGAIKVQAGPCLRCTCLRRMRQGLRRRRQGLTRVSLRALQSSMLWGYDMIGGAVPDNEKNALLDEAAKTWMYRMHTEGGCGPALELNPKSKALQRVPGCFA